MTLSLVGNSPSITSSTSATTPVVPDGGPTDTLLWVVDWMVDYTGTAYPDEDDRPELTNGVAGAATHVHTTVGGIDSPTEAWGIDTGKRACSVFVAEATSATGVDDAVTFNAQGSGTARFVAAACIRISKASGKVVTVTATGGQDQDKSNGLTIAGMTDIGATVGDILIGFVAVVPDSINTGLVLGWPGCTLGTQSNIVTGAITSGNDVRMNVRTAPVTAGTSTGAPTLTSATVGSAGAGVVLRLREEDPPVAMSAGPDQTGIEPGATVTLDASASSAAAGYAWTQVAGSPTVALSSTSAESPTFEAPLTLDGETLTFRVTDTGSSAYDEVDVEVLPASRRVKIGGAMVPVLRRIHLP